MAGFVLLSRFWTCTMLDSKKSEKEVGCRYGRKHSAECWTVEVCPRYSEQSLQATWATTDRKTFLLRIEYGLINLTSTRSLGGRGNKLQFSISSFATCCLKPVRSPWYFDGSHRSSCSHWQRHLRPILLNHILILRSLLLSFNFLHPLNVLLFPCPLHADLWALDTTRYYSKVQKVLVHSAQQHCLFSRNALNSPTLWILGSWQHPDKLVKWFQ